MATKTFEALHDISILLSEWTLSKTSIASFELAKHDTEWRLIKERECRGILFRFEHKRSGNPVDNIQSTSLQTQSPSNQSQGWRERSQVFTTLQHEIKCFLASKHLNGRSEAVCLSVSNSIIFFDQKVKSIKAYIYIRPEAPKLIRPDVH